MGRPKHTALPSQIGDILARIQAWRSSRKSGAPMPEDLWRAAGEWASKLGINPVCKALGLSYSDLKKRSQTKQGLQVYQRPDPVPPTFAELALDPGARMRAPGDGAFFAGGLSQAGPTVEVTNPDGGRLVMRLAPGSVVDAMGLLESFLGRRA